MDSTGRAAESSYSLSATAPLAITSDVLASGSIDAFYSTVLAAAGGRSPYKWAMLAGQLPPGLNLGASGALTGTPYAAGQYPFAVQVSDQDGRTAEGVFSITITSSGPTGPALSISTPELPEGIIGTAYSATLGAAGGTPPYTWSVDSGQLPEGLVLSAAGALSGIPSTAGATSVTIRVADAGGSQALGTLNISIVAGLAILTTGLPGATVGTPYSVSLMAGGGEEPYTWSLDSGQLPEGLTLSPAGAVAGTPSAPVTSEFQVKVSDAGGRQAAKPLALKVEASLSIVTIALPAGTVGVPYSATLAATGGTAPYTWSLASGELPGGLTISAQGTIAGTPTVNGSATFAVTVADASNTTAPRTYTLTVFSSTNAGVRVLTNSLHLGFIKKPYEAAMTATGGAPPYTWSVASGQLPQGMTLDASGHIMGAPALGGAFLISLTVTDSTGATATKAFTVPVFELELDKYGGLVDVPCPQGPRAHFYTDKIQNRWTFCTPAGNFFWSTGVTNITWMDTPVIAAKYGTGRTSNYSLNWALAAARRLRDWGFNTTEGGLLYILPGYNHPEWGTSDQTIPVKLPYVIDLAGTTRYATYNVNNWGPGPTKNYSAAYKRSINPGYIPGSVDAFDPNYPAFVAARLSSDILRFAWTGANTDYILAVVTDETDYLGGVRAGADFQLVSNGRPGGASPDAHWAVQTLISTPSISAIRSIDCFRGCPADILYADPIFHSKHELASFLQQRGDGGPGYASIAELNAAWGSNYTSFGSDARTWTDILGKGDGLTRTFAATTSRHPITPMSVRIAIAGILAAGDDGSGPRAPTPTSAGNLVAGGTSDSSIGTINYSTGAVAVTFTVAPPAGALIAITYETNGWGAGHGLLDEDGTCPSRAAGQPCWVPDAIHLTGASSSMKRDLDEFLYHWVKKVLESQTQPVRAAMPGVLVAGPMLGSWGTPPRAAVLRAAAECLDFMYLGTIPPDNPFGAIPDTQARVDFVARNAGDKPWVLWEGFAANPDSYMSAFSNSAGDMFPTQTARGQYYAKKLQDVTDTEVSPGCNCSSSGTRPVIGLWWWDYMDMTNEQVNWGLVTPRDDPYDGVCATTSAGADAYGSPTGCIEGLGCGKGNYGDFLSWVVDANLNVLRRLRQAR